MDKVTQDLVHPLLEFALVGLDDFSAQNQDLSASSVVRCTAYWVGLDIITCCSSIQRTIEGTTWTCFFSGDSCRRLVIV